MNKDSRAPSSRQPDAKREILRISEIELGKNGTAAFEVRRVAERVNLGESSILHHFHSSEELILETVIYSYNRYIVEMQETLAFEKDPERIIRTWISKTLDWCGVFPGIGVVLELPTLAFRSGTRRKTSRKSYLKKFDKEVSKLGIKNAILLYSAIRALQKKQSYKKLNSSQIIRALISDKKYSTYCTVIGFATLGGGLWIAGRHPENLEKPFWRDRKFDANSQLKSSIDTILVMLRNGI